jgi:hypothetical protein
MAGLIGDLAMRRGFTWGAPALRAQPGGGYPKYRRLVSAHARRGAAIERQLTRDFRRVVMKPLRRRAAYRGTITDAPGEKSYALKPHSNQIYACIVVPRDRARDRLQQLAVVAIQHVVECCDRR